MGIFGNLFQKKSSNDPRYNEVVFGSWINSIINSTPDKDKFITEGYQSNATVYSIIDLISKSAANVGLGVYEIKDKESLKQYKSLSSNPDKVAVKSDLTKRRALKPAFDSDLAKLLKNPNPKQGTAEFISELIAFKALTGDGFMWGLPRSGGKGLTELNILPSHLMEASGGDIFNPVEGWFLEYNNWSKAIPKDQVGHIKNFNPDYTSTGNHIFGQSPLQAAYRNLQTNNAAITTGKNYLDNQGARGILSVIDAHGFTAEQAASLRDQYESRYGGAAKAGQTVMTNQKLDWTEMGLPLADLALIEQYNLTVKDIASVYKVPSILLNDTQASTFNNYREAKKYLYLQAVFPELIQLRDELNRWLVPMYGDKYYIDFDFLSVPELQEDMEKVVDQLSKAWWMTPNEKREAMKLEPQDDKAMDEVYILANLIPLADGVTPKEIGGGGQQTLNDHSDYIDK